MDPSGELALLLLEQYLREFSAAQGIGRRQLVTPIIRTQWRIAQVAKQDAALAAAMQQRLCDLAARLEVALPGVRR